MIDTPVHRRYASFQIKPQVNTCDSRYIVAKKIEDGKCSVFGVTDTKNTSDKLVVKLFQQSMCIPHLLSSNTLSNKPMMITTESFYRREVAILSKLQHPNIVRMSAHGKIDHRDPQDSQLFEKTFNISDLSPVHRGVWRESKIYYIVLEQLSKDLFHLITERGHVFYDEKFTRTVFHQLVDGLAYLHSNKIAHLDIKPENVLFDQNGTFKFCDFDQSIIISEKQQCIGMGTSGFRPPELEHSCLNIELAYSADIYSLGVLLFVMATGSFPYWESDKFDVESRLQMMFERFDDYWEMIKAQIGAKQILDDANFKNLFYSMTRAHPNERISIDGIRESKWYQGEIYTSNQMSSIMRKFVFVTTPINSGSSHHKNSQI